MRQLSKYMFFVHCDVTNPQVQKLLSHIPGLKLDTKGAVGSYDACWLAEERLNFEHDLVLSTQSPMYIYSPVRKPRIYQQEGVLGISKRLIRYGGAILADEMGLGKTYQALCVAETLQSTQTVIVCPASVRLTWRDEIKQTFNQDAYVVKASKDNIPNNVRYVIVSYELVEAVDSVLVPTMVILDEAHMLRGRKTKRFSAISKFVSSARYRLALTGTPLWNRPKDTWGVLNSILPYKFGSAGEFDLAYCDGKINEWGSIDNNGVSRSDELKKRIEFYQVRRLQEGVASELPSITRQVMWVDANDKALEASHYARRYRSLKNIVTAEQATLECKKQAAIDLAAEAQQFLLFTWQRKDAEDIADTLNLNGTSCVFIHGGFTHEQRQELIAQAKSCQQGIVATIDSLSVGVNLQYVAHIGIMHYIDCNPKKMAQAEKRIHRLGSTQPVIWYYVGAKETIDEEIISLNLEKLSQSAEVMNASEQEYGMVQAFNQQNNDSETYATELYSRMDS